MSVRRFGVMRGEVESDEVRQLLIQFRLLSKPELDGPVAQWTESLVPDQDVAGSNPVGSVGEFFKSN